MKYLTNKKCIASMICFFCVVVIWLIGYKCYQATPQKNFHNTINSIVEVKATEGKQSSFGTAVFIGEKKYLVTNAHVVVHKIQNKKRPYKTIQIRFADESEYREVHIKSFNEDKDIALLEATNISDRFVQGLRIADSKKIDFGNKVYAIGNAISISQGIVSMPKVIIDYNEKDKEMIQADINISEGNSGGALLNQNGKLIGITTFRTKDQNGNIIYGNAFAIPINDVVLYIKKQS